jgi:hypothetical protein
MVLLMLVSLLLVASLLSLLFLTSKVLTCLLFAFIVVSIADDLFSTDVSSAARFPFIVGVVSVFLQLAFL